MTEYDYSPEAYERYIARQNRIAKWVADSQQPSPTLSSAVSSPSLSNRLFSNHHGLTPGRNSDESPTSTGEKVMAIAGDRRRSSVPERWPVKQRRGTPRNNDPSHSDDSSNGNESRHSAASHHSSASHRSTRASSRRRTTSYRRPVSRRGAASHDGTRSTSSFSHVPNSHPLPPATCECNITHQLSGENETDETEFIYII